MLELFTPDASIRVQLRIELVEGRHALCYLKIWADTLGRPSTSTINLGWQTTLATTRMLRDTGAEGLLFALDVLEKRMIETGTTVEQPARLSKAPPPGQ